MATKEGDPILENLEASPEEEEITLSDSELDDVLNSADIAPETVEAGQDVLEQYGVWVKGEPQDIAATGGSDLDFELADLGSGEDSEADLTEEEEQLLGELEADGDVGEGLSVLEDDLEELGKGAAGSAEAGSGGLDLDIAEAEELSEEFPDLEEDTLDGLESLETSERSETERDAEIEVPLSDRSTIEEHYEDLAPLEGVPSTPGMPGGRTPPDILERIENDLGQIKAEIQNLKSELAGFGTGARSVEVKPAPSAGAFEKGEDDTIALTGDELDNILNTADITEETAEPPRKEASDELEDLESPQMPEDLQVLPDAEAAPEISLDEDILEPGSLDLTEEPFEEIEAPREPAAAAAQGEAGEGLEELEELEAQAEEIPELDEELSLEEEPAGSADAAGSALEELEELEELEVPEMPLEELPATEGLTIEEAGDEVEDLTLAEEELPSTAGGPAPLDELAEESIEELAAEPLEELPEESIEELAAEPLEELSEIDTAAEEPSLEAPRASQPEEELVPEEELELAELAEEAEGPEPVPGPAAPPAASTGGFAEIPRDLQQDIRSVLSYLDQLLRDLPDEKVQEFAKSQYFGIYKRMFEELGLEG